MVVLERDVVVGELSRQALLHVLDQIVLGRRVDDDLLGVGVVLGAGSGLAAAGERCGGHQQRQQGGKYACFLHSCKSFLFPALLLKKDTLRGQDV